MQRWLFINASVNRVTSTVFLADNVIEARRIAIQESQSWIEDAEDVLGLQSDARAREAAQAAREHGFSPVSSIGSYGSLWQTGRTYDPKYSR